ncbi:hypothetical protein Golob_013156 [Gossypium lobatum]|uniref:Uncharacterized protein n=1 Tax=Gossypium lobatum TaxID=34289 RepID=A0A7J8LNZ3_9ROSI|nr:hypothetical protein [Gossypium lobatum]
MDIASTKQTRHPTQNFIGDSLLHQFQELHKNELRAYDSLIGHVIHPWTRKSMSEATDDELTEDDGVTPYSDTTNDVFTLTHLTIEGVVI